MKSNAVSIKANRKRVLVYGYLNLNLGDDLFFRTLAERYPSVDFYVFSGIDYSKVVRRPNFHTIHRNRINRIFASHLPYQFSFYGFDAIVYIGGSIFIERGESGTCTTLRNLNKLHRKFPKLPIHIIGSNYGPERTAAFRREVERVFEFVESVTMRDSYSQGLFEGNPKVKCAADVVFGMDTSALPAPDRSGDVGVSVIDLSFRENLREHTEWYEAATASLIESSVQNGKCIKLFAFCRGEGDTTACERICARLKSDIASRVEIVTYDGNIDNFLTSLRSVESLYAARFHATILGALFGIPTVPVIYSDKTQYILNDIGWKGATIDIRRADAQPQNPAPYTLDDDTLQGLRLSAQKQFYSLDSTLQ
jgi:colanic acid/amylovoran biosynthesis protein